MSTKYLIPVLVLLTFLFLVYPFRSAYGCQCNLPTVCQAFSRADAVFIGKVLNIRKSAKTRADIVEVEFGVERTFKGPDRPSQLVQYRWAHLVVASNPR